MISLDPSDHQVALEKEIASFAKENLNDDVEQRDASGTFDRKLWEKAGEIKLQGLAIPSEFGGRGLDAIDTSVALKVLGCNCGDNGLTFGIGAHLLASAIPIALFGSDGQKQKWLPDMCSGRIISCNAITENQAGSDIFDLKTEATAGEGGFVINGQKTYCTLAPVADVALVYATTDRSKGFFGGITAFLVNTKTEGFIINHVHQKMGVKTLPMGSITLDNVVVSEEHVLGGVGGGGPIFTKSMDWERTQLAALHTGQLKQLLELTIDYAKKRKAGGQPIGSYQGVSHPIAEMRVELEACELMSLQAAAKLKAGKDVGITASMTKLFVSEQLQNAAKKCLQILGGSGYSDGNYVERTLRDAMGASIYSGTSEIQKNIIARNLGL